MTELKFKNRLLHSNNMGKRRGNHEYTTNNQDRTDGVDLPSVQDVIGKLLNKTDAGTLPKTTRDKIAKFFYIQCEGDVNVWHFYARDPATGFVYWSDFVKLVFSLNERYKYYTVCLVEQTNGKIIETNQLGPYCKDKDGMIFTTGVGKKARTINNSNPLADVAELLLEMRSDIIT